MKLDDFTAEKLDRRIVLYKVNYTADEEMNRAEELVYLRSVWANVEVKNAVDTVTQTGERPQIKYVFTIRYAKDIIENVKKIGYKDKILEVSAPIYETGNKFITVEAVEHYGKRFDEFSSLP